MRISSRRSLLKYLDDLDLRLALETEPRTVTVVISHSGSAHYRWSSCQAAKNRQPTELGIRELLEHAMCPECESSLASAALSNDARTILEAHAQAKSVDRLIEGSKLGTSAGRDSKLKTSLEVSERNLDRLSNGSGAYATAATQVKERVQAAQRKLANATGGDRVKKKILERVRTNLVPHEARHIPLDDEQHIIGIYPQMDGTNVTGEILNAFRVPGSTHQVLAGPRYLVDYLYREMHRSREYRLVVSAPAADVSIDQMRIAAELWDPQNAGPLAIIGTALAAAGDAIATPAA